MRISGNRWMHKYLRRFINLLFVFPLCPMGAIQFAFSFLPIWSTVAIYGFDKWKFQSGKKCEFFAGSAHISFGSKICRFLFTFYYISLVSFCHNFHLKWSVFVVVVFVYLFCAFNHFACDGKTTANVYLKYFK